MKDIDLVILAGGKGTRIKKYLNNMPKPMLKFNHIYFLKYLINNYAKYPFKKIYILTGYKSNIIYKNFNNKIYNFIKVKCINEKKLLGTGGALYSLKKEKINDFVLTNGDTIFDIDLINFIKTCKQGDIGSMALSHKKNNINSLKLNNLGLKKNKIIYTKKNKLINGGIYFFKKKLLNLIPSKICSLENDILPELIKKNKISGNIYDNFFLDIGTPKYLKDTSYTLKKNYYITAAFLDRDGVINYDYGYVHKVKNFIFKKGVLEGLKLLIKKKYYIFIVTNQAGIAKNIFKEIDFVNLHIYLKKKLSLQNIFFDDVQYCPYHPSAKIKKYKKKNFFEKTWK
jgi:HAD superfamily hydrolase (TIGR01662 family)